MSVIAFDTLKYSKKLIEAGVPQKQAEGQARALADAVEDQLATSQDIKNTENTLRAEIKEVENTLRGEIKESEYRVLTKLGGLILICTAILGIISAHH